jgi:uracil-DNA glycosylase
MTEANLFRYTSGPRDAEIILVGEAWGQDEAARQEPFCGPAGAELDRMLFEAGLHRSNILCTNIVHTRPNLANEFAAGFTLAGKVLPSSPFYYRGLLATEQLREGCANLFALISRVRPRLVIGCGNWPLWALTSHAELKPQKSKVDNLSYRVPSGIGSWRGSQTYTEQIDGTAYPFLPIYHPSAILRAWELRSPTVHDLRTRAARFIANKTSWEAPRRPILPLPTFDQARDYLLRLLSRLEGGEKVWIATDLETYQRKHIVCAGIAADPDPSELDGIAALCLPFFNFDEAGVSYHVWPHEEEVELVDLYRRVITHCNARVTNQNIIYDAQYLFRNLAIRIRPAFDTMVGHHLLWPRTPKDLSYLSSLYCDHHLHWKEESQEWDTRTHGLAALCEYNCKDCLSTLEITHVLRGAISSAGMDELMADRMQQWEMAFDMMLDGVNYDVALAQRYRTDLFKLSEETSAWLISAMPEDLRYTSAGGPWYTSPKFQQEIFYDKIGVAPVIHKKTKRPTLDKEAFEVIRKRAPWLTPVLDKLELQRSIGVFTSNFLDIKLGPGSRFYCGFNIAGTDTFRFSSQANSFDEGGNFQNIPKKEEE